jgi:hypothetical protein
VSDDLVVGCVGAGASLRHPGHERGVHWVNRGLLWPLSGQRATIAIRDFTPERVPTSVYLESIHSIRALGAVACRPSRGPILISLIRNDLYAPLPLVNSPGLRITNILGH